MLSSALESLTGGVPDAPLPRWVVPCIFLFAVFLRVAVSLHPYSGEGRPPMFGDYEAQRHWMEITLHTPLGEWYRQTPSNDLGYWGLDYPPLTAYQSWAYGRVVASFEPAAVALGTSRGYETSSSRLLMRWSVVASDLIFFFPGVYAFIRAFYAARETPARTSWALAAALVAPAGVLIDHGHFQYNGISLGLVAAAAAAVVSDRDLLGAALFSLALNHKQMSLYYAPAFFAHMLGKCLRRDTRAGRALAIARLGAVVLGVFAILWAPFALAESPDGVENAGVGGLLAVLRRLAPFQRGIYEDYVSNFYCATNPIFRWKSLPTRVSARLALALTVTAFAPSVAHQIAAERGGFRVVPRQHRVGVVPVQCPGAREGRAPAAPPKHAPLAPSAGARRVAAPDRLLFHVAPSSKGRTRRRVRRVRRRVLRARRRRGAREEGGREEKRYAFGRTVDDAPRDDGRDRDCGDCAPRRGDDSTAEGVPAPARSDLLGVVVRGVRGRGGGVQLETVEDAGGAAGAGAREARESARRVTRCGDGK